MSRAKKFENRHRRSGPRRLPAGALPSIPPDRPMCGVERLRRALCLRRTHPYDYDETALWAEEIAAFCEELPASLRFVAEDCTDEELDWLGEVFEELLAQTRSRELLTCLRRRVARLTDPSQRTALAQDLEDAAFTVW